MAVEEEKAPGWFSKFMDGFSGGQKEKDTALQEKIDALESRLAAVDEFFSALKEAEEETPESEEVPKGGLTKAEVKKMLDEGGREWGGATLSLGDEKVKSLEERLAKEKFIESQRSKLGKLTDEEYAKAKTELETAWDEHPKMRNKPEKLARLALEEAIGNPKRLEEIGRGGAEVLSGFYGGGNAGDGKTVSAKEQKIIEDYDIKDSAKFKEIQENLKNEREGVRK